jgi:hypothetical protein
MKLLVVYCQALLKKKKHESEEDAYLRSADEAVKLGSSAAGRALYWTFFSVVVFVLGVLAAGALTLVVRT